MRFFLFPVIAALALCHGGQAIAEDNDAAKGGGKTPDQTDALNTLFSRYGFSSGQESNSHSCKVSMRLNQSTFVEHIDELKALGILNKDLSQTAINMEPNIISMAFAIQAAPMTTKIFYDNNDKADSCEFSQTITEIDDYGNEKNIEMFSYNFTRSIYKKINWDNFKPQNLIKVAPHFHIGPQFQLLIMKEQSQ